MRQVLRAGELGRPRGMGWRGRQEGGSGRGTHVNPWLIHVNVWQKLLQYCKVISLQLIKINGKNKILSGKGNKNQIHNIRSCDLKRKKKYFGSVPSKVLGPAHSLCSYTMYIYFFDN